MEGLIRLMNTSDDIAGPMNLGNPREFTILELAEKILKITGSKSEIRFEKLPLDDPKQRRPDISFAQKALNWKPEIVLEEGLRKTIAYFDQLLT